MKRMRPLLPPKIEQFFKLAVLNSLGASALLTPAARRRVYRACGVPTGDWARIMPGQRFAALGVTFENCFVSYGCFFDAGTSSILIEDGVSIAAGVVISAVTHELGAPERRAGPDRSAPVLLSRGAWVGARSTILPGVAIGAGAVVGAGSVVTGDVAANTLVVGVPAALARHLPSSN